MIAIFCTIHPEYKAVFAPKTDCPQCKSIWTLASADNGPAILKVPSLTVATKQFSAGFKRKKM